jgi:isopentenyl-diphosphate Delta-isomerase
MLNNSTNLPVPSSNNVDQPDEVVVVDEQDHPQKTMDKVAAHRHPAQLHRAVSVWLIRQSQTGKEVLLQQRSPGKITGATWWGNAVCGNVWPEESYEACAQRRLEQELGIDASSFEKMNNFQPLYTFTYQAYVNPEFGEAELDYVFGGEYLGEIKPQPNEVTEVMWVSVDSVLSVAEEALKSYPSARQTMLAESTSDLEGETYPVEVMLNGRRITLVPWMMIMLKDERLREWLEQSDIKS